MFSNKNELNNKPVDAVSKHSFNDLPQDGNNPAAEPLVTISQIKHLIHQQQHDTHWNVFFIILGKRQDAELIF